MGSSQTGWDTRITVVIVAGAFMLGLLLRLPLRARVRARLVSGVLGTIAGFSAAVTIALLGVEPTVAVWIGLVGVVVFGLVAAAIGLLLGHLIAAADEAV